MAVQICVQGRQHDASQKKKQQRLLYSCTGTCAAAALPHLNLQLNLHFKAQAEGGKGACHGVIFAVNATGCDRITADRITRVQVVRG